MATNQQEPQVKPRRKFVGSSKPSTNNPTPLTQNTIPDDILQNEELNIAINLLPQNYSFEIHKTIHWIKKENASVVGLQFPEGLQMFACTISDILEKYDNVFI